MTDTFKIGGNGGLRLGRRVGVTVDDRSDSLSLGLFLSEYFFCLGGSWKDTELPPGLGWALRIWGSLPEYFASFIFFDILGGFFARITSILNISLNTLRFEPNIYLCMLKV